MGQTHAWPITITGGEETGICQWITDQGGWNNLPIEDVILLIRCYFNHTGCSFIGSLDETIGVIKYYFGDLPGGNALTGCTFSLDVLIQQEIQGGNEDNDNFITIPITPMRANSLEITHFCWKEALLIYDIIEWTIELGTNGAYTQIGWGLCPVTPQATIPTFGCITPCQIPCSCDPNPVNFQEQDVDTVRIHMWSNLPLSGMKPNFFKGIIKVI